MIYGHACDKCWCKCCMQWKIFKFRIFIVLYIHFPSSGIKAYYHMIYMLKILIITRVAIIYINICKCCKYRLCLVQVLWLNILLVARVVTKDALIFFMLVLFMVTVYSTVAAYWSYNTVAAVLFTVTVVVLFTKKKIFLIIFLVGLTWKIYNYMQ